MQCVMMSDLVALPEPNIDSDLGLPCGVKPFGVEDFFSQGAVKAFLGNKHTCFEHP